MRKEDIIIGKKYYCKFGSTYYEIIARGISKKKNRKKEKIRVMIPLLEQYRRISAEMVIDSLDDDQMQNLKDEKNRIHLIKLREQELEKELEKRRNNALSKIGLNSNATDEDIRYAIINNMILPEYKDFKKYVFEELDAFGRKHDLLESLCYGSDYNFGFETICSFIENLNPWLDDILEYGFFDYYQENESYFPDDCDPGFLFDEFCDILEEDDELKTHIFHLAEMQEKNKSA